MSLEECIRLSNLDNIQRIYIFATILLIIAVVQIDTVD